MQVGAKLRVVEYPRSSMHYQFPSKIKIGNIVTARAYEYNSIRIAESTRDA